MQYTEKEKEDRKKRMCGGRGAWGRGDACQALSTGQNERLRGIRTVYSGEHSPDRGGRERGG
jgi:hypothetical protein